MRLNDSNRVLCDILVIGGGGTGLRAAIEARERGADVLVVSKTRVGYGNNTFISKANIATAGLGDPQDNPEVHLKDTVIGGRFLSDQKLVAGMVREAGAQVPFLEKCGVNFAKRQGKIRVGSAAGHSYPRHVRGENRIGKDLILPLKAYAERIGVRFSQRVFVTRLFSCDNRIAAASGVGEDGSFQVFVAKCVILATGGFSHIYLHTDNAPGITGDGQALAFGLGVPIADMEFVQFYPTALGSLGQRILLYEALVLEEGALLKNAKGEEIIAKHGLNDPLALTRDRLAQAIMHEIIEGLDVQGGVIMDLSPISHSRRAKLRPLLPSKDSEERLEFIVSPTTHFCMGGIMIDENTETSLAGLFAAGEVCAGIHGANRLAGNALCEVFVLGGVAGRRAAKRATVADPPQIPKEEIAREGVRLESLLSQGGQDPKGLVRLLKEVMWQKAGIVRHLGSLRGSLQRIEELKALSIKCSIVTPRELIRWLELQNMLLLSEMICRAALMRTESRGSHYRSDYPEEDNTHWLKNIVIRKGETGMALETVPVSLNMIAPGVP
jgi:succinate dehydrogenase/fumarate reductase flavoprotein subunit